MKALFSKITTTVCLLAPSVGFAQSATLLTTVTNPAPGFQDFFGASVATLGNDRVLIGASLDNTAAFRAGAAYLFSTNGTLLTTFVSPASVGEDGATWQWFGDSVAALGNDRVLIGAPEDDTGAGGAGAVFLFSTNGKWLGKFSNPTPTISERFGQSVAAVGSDHVLIGTPQDSTGAGAAGVAYLFNTNRALITTFINPTPNGDDNFGESVAALGNDRVLIGARGDDTGAPYAGAAYLFSTNGTLLTTFTNPVPVEGSLFGGSAAAVGSDQALIGGRGAAYLFSTNGMLLTTFTNPSPANTGWFGYAVTAMGSDRVLISDPGGAVYVFSTNGELLSTLTNATAANGNAFGRSVAVLGTDRVLIGADRESVGAVEAGAAYVFSIEPLTPRLSVTHSGGNVTVSWPKTATGFVLDQTPAFAPPPAAIAWSQVPTATYQTNATSIFITQSAPNGNKFFRLHKP